MQRQIPRSCFTKKDITSQFSSAKPPEYVSYINNKLFVSEGYYTSANTSYSNDGGTTWVKLPTSPMQYCYRVAWSNTLSLYVGIDIQN